MTDELRLHPRKSPCFHLADPLHTHTGPGRDGRERQVAFTPTPFYQEAFRTAEARQGRIDYPPSCIGIFCADHRQFRRFFMRAQIPPIDIVDPLRSGGAPESSEIAVPEPAFAGSTLVLRRNGDNRDVPEHLFAHGGPDEGSRIGKERHTITRCKAIDTADQGEVAFGNKVIPLVRLGRPCARHSPDQGRMCPKQIVECGGRAVRLPLGDPFELIRPVMRRRSVYGTGAIVGSVPQLFHRALSSPHFPRDRS
nr:hypothetical protein [Marivita sp.]